MKNLFACLAVAVLCLGAGIEVHAQTPSADTESTRLSPPVESEEELEVFEFTEDELPRYDPNELQRLVVYPDEARKNNIQGRTVVEFVLATTGRAEKVRVIYSDAAMFDEPSMNAIRQMTFVPARQDGKPVRLRMTIVVNFVLED